MSEPIGSPTPSEPAVVGSAPPPVLEFRGIVKAFPGQIAVDDVSFSVSRGEIHALVGENGAGKTTLIKCLGGAYHPDSGSILMDGEAVHIDNQHEATLAGIGFLHQEPALVPQLSVTENINLGLGYKLRRGGLIDWKAQREMARVMLEKVGLDVRPSERLGDLSVAERQLVAIARLLVFTERVVVLDEPTAPLAQTEVDRLFTIIRRMSEAGVGVIYISHRLEEIFRLADRVSVLRNGKLIATKAVSELNPLSLTRLIVGKDSLGGMDSLVAADYEAPTPRRGKIIVSVHDLSDRILQGVSFDLHEGEILGLAGLAGAGRTNILRAVFGAGRLRSGSIQLDGKPLVMGHPTDAIARGIALVTEERKRDGYIPAFPLWQHITLPWLSRFKAGPVLQLGRERAAAATALERFDVRARSVETKLRELSGGNQQKAILARWLSQDLRVLLLDEPTHGVDVGAKEDIYQIIRGLAAVGLSMVVASSELEELEAICERVLLLVDGRLVGELSGQEVTKENILTALLTSNLSGGHAAHVD